jgi:hypothetical protein
MHKKRLREYSRSWNFAKDEVIKYDNGWPLTMHTIVPHAQAVLSERIASFNLIECKYQIALDTSASVENLMHQSATMLELIQVAKASTHAAIAAWDRCQPSPSLESKSILNFIKERFASDSSDGLLQIAKLRCVSQSLKAQCSQFTLDHAYSKCKVGKIQERLVQIALNDQKSIALWFHSLSSDLLGYFRISDSTVFYDTSTTKMLEWSSKSCSMYQLQGTTIVRPRHAKVYMFNPAPMQIVVEVGATHRNRTFKCSIDSPSPSVDCIVSFGEKGTPEFRFRRTSEPVTNCPFVISMQSGNVYLSRYGLV